MKNVFNIILLCACLGSFTQGARAFIEWRSLSASAAAFEERIKVLNTQERLLSRFKSLAPLKLEGAYVSFIDDMHSIARAYGLGISIDGGAPLFVPSVLEGLNEARLKVGFSHISSRGALVSMLGVLDARSRLASWLVEKLAQEKDSLVIEAVLYGI